MAHFYLPTILLPNFYPHKRVFFLLTIFFSNYAIASARPILFIPLLNFSFRKGRVRLQEMPLDTEEEEREEDFRTLAESEAVLEDCQSPQKRTKKCPPKVRGWKRNQDIRADSRSNFIHPTPDCLKSPFQYFEDMFPLNLIDEIVFQTNLYARQKDVNTSFQIDRHEFMVFLGIVIYMGVCDLPAIEDYWAMMTRVPQIADCMSSKRFCTIRSLLHFNNNDHCGESNDRFYKIRPIFDAITKQFQMIKETPTQSVDEVMVAYKGTRAGNL